MQLNKHVLKRWRWWVVNCKQFWNALTLHYFHSTSKSSINQPMKSQIARVDNEGGKALNGKQFTSKDTQTNLGGDEVETLRAFHDKHLEKQLKLDDELRWNIFRLFFEPKSPTVFDYRNIEDMFTLQLSKSDDKIVELTSAISSLQVLNACYLFCGCILRCHCVGRRNWTRKSAAMRRQWSIEWIWRLMKLRAKSNSCRDKLKLLGKSDDPVRRARKSILNSQNPFK